MLLQRTITFYSFYFCFTKKMKSEQQAQRTRNNLCNNSTAKSQYSFGRDARFKDRNRKKWQTSTFYNLPSQISKRAAVIGMAKRDIQKERKEEGPPPNQYNPHQIQPTSQIVFGPGREKCSSSSIFYNTTINYPGPGRYNPQAASEKRKGFAFAGRAKTTFETISPGPKYSFQSTLIDRNKVLSNLKRTGGVRIVLPNNRSRSVLTEPSESKTTPPLANSMVQGYMSYKGEKIIGRSGNGVIMGRQKRFRPVSAKTSTPGPGQYEYFSDFIESEKK